MSPVETLLAEVLAAHAGTSTYLRVGQWAYRCTCGVLLDGPYESTAEVRAAYHAHVAVKQAKALREAGLLVPTDPPPPSSDLIGGL